MSPLMGKAAESHLTEIPNLDLYQNYAPEFSIQFILERSTFDLIGYCIVFTKSERFVPFSSDEILLDGWLLRRWGPKIETGF